MKYICRAGRNVRRQAGDQTKKSDPKIAEVGRRRRPEEYPAYLAAAIGLSSEAIVVTDPRGFIQFVNPAFEQITGYTREEATGCGLHILDSGRHDEAFYEGIRNALACDGAWKGRLISRKKDGTLYYEECTNTLVRNRSGNIINHVSIRRDVTERLKLESIAEEIDTMKNSGYVFSGIRHEIGNAVNTLAMILGFLKYKLPQLDTPAIAEYLESASDEAQKAAYIIRCLRNYNVHAQPEIQQVNLPEFVEKFLALVREDFMAKGIEIGVSMGANADWCYADPRALHQVMLNLLINASDALEGRACPKVSIAVLRSGDSVRVRVEDNGCGMSEGQLHNLFKPFYTTKAHGTGLGLAITKKLLTAMNSSIEVTSRRDIGTAIDIIIPGARITTGNTAGTVMAATGISTPTGF